MSRCFHNGASEHEQQLFEVGIQFSAWNSEDDVLNLQTRELSAQRMNEIQSAISREVRDVRMSTMDIPSHVATHAPQQIKLQAALRKQLN